MSQTTLYAGAGLALFAIGISGLAFQPHVVRKVLAANIAGSGVLLFLVAIARRLEGEPDPIPHALVLTGIVVTVSATALGLVIARRVNALEHGAEGDRQEPTGGP